MKRKTILCLLAISVLVLAVSISNATTFAKPADAYTIDWYTIDSGGAQNLSGGSYTLSGTTGQFDAGSQSSGAYSLKGGYWVELFGYRLNLPLIMR